MATTDTVLITGCQGQLGMDLMAHLTTRFTVVGIDQQDLDISNYSGLLELCRMIRPRWVVHTAAYTDVDGCESNPGLAIAVNADGTENVARAAFKVGAKLLYYSTDYVFDGQASEPYVETDAPNPQTIYGQSKLAGEERVRECIENYVIMRIAWVYGQYGNNFVKTITRLGREQLEKKSRGEAIKPLHVVDDQIGNPTWTIEVARQTERMFDSGLFGLFHATAEGQATWYQLTNDIFGYMNLPVEVVPCTSADYPRPAPRPHFSALENQRLNEAGINGMRHYRDALADFLTLHGGIL